ncbi:tau-cadinol synthase isoform X1 [Setaria viridis]|nr:tau-cadinol synthase-like isoform X1 [Setaria viridis]QJA42400.1 terpene synthase TPS29 [Setaria viridis]
MALISAATSCWKAAPEVHPSVWGDFFINYIPEPLQISDEEMLDRVNQLKGEVSGLFEACKNVVEKMDLVDVLQHLGIDHHFKEQIATTLSSIHRGEFNSSSLHEVALRFRLLRQHGFWVSAGEFNKFKHEDGSFINDITNDPKGLLSLYNAANLLTHDEGALEEALLFARRHLELMKSSLKSPLAEQVERALKIPLPRTLKRVEAVSYIPEYSVEQRYNPAILELAKLDFNLLQRLHQKELKTISQWWKDLSEDIKLEYVRDRIVECYFWAYSVYYEQEYARARMILARLFVLTSLLDDTYDDHATLEECRELTKAIERWDESDISLLPEYIKKLFLKVIRNFKEFEDELEAHEKYRIAYARKGFQLISKSYLQEAEWSHHNYIPSFNDHVNVSTISAGAQLLCVGLLVGMGDVATKEAFEWTIGNNDAIRACAEVFRFMDDMADFKRGRNKMDVATSVECYIKEHNVSAEVALAKFGSFVDDAWKTLNHAIFEHHALLPVLQRVTNLAMSMMLFFLDQRDRYTNSKELKETLKSQFVKHVPL